MTRRALVIVDSDVATDPRVIRQLGWLRAAGWSPDSLGRGPAPEHAVRHFPLAPVPEQLRSKLGRAAMHALLPNRAKLSLLGTRRVPAEAVQRIRSGAYDLIVFNDIDFLPWVRDSSLFTDRTLRARIHLDVHEHFPVTLPPGSRLRIRVASYHSWLRSHIGDERFTSRSTVANAIADAYATEFGFERPAIVRNAPPYEALEPVPPTGRVRLLHHGVAQWKRGLRELVEAMRLVDEGAELTFMLTGASSVIDELRALTADLGDRVRIVPPVAMSEVARAINDYDVEVMFYPPRTENLRFALPNKLFEAVQGRLGLLIGRSPMMEEIVDRYGNGVVVGGWRPEDLATAIRGLDPGTVARVKAASHAAAHELSAEREGERFVAAATGAD